MHDQSLPVLQQNMAQEAQLGLLDDSPLSNNRLLLERA
jgi:hypothetical protein